MNNWQKFLCALVRLSARAYPHSNAVVTAAEVANTTVRDVTQAIAADIAQTAWKARAPEPVSR